MSSKCCACHAKTIVRCYKCPCRAKRGGAHSHHSSPDFRRPLCSKCCACHAKTIVRCSKCCPCRAKRGGAHSHQSSPDFRSGDNIRLPPIDRVPRNSSMARLGGQFRDRARRFDGFCDILGFRPPIRTASGRRSPLASSECSC